VEEERLGESGGGQRKCIRTRGRRAQGTNSVSSKGLGFCFIHFSFCADAGPTAEVAFRTLAKWFSNGDVTGLGGAQTSVGGRPVAEPPPS